MAERRNDVVDTARTSSAPHRRITVKVEHRHPVTAADRLWMEQAIDVARWCPPAEGAFSVGAVIVAADGSVISLGYSRESDDRIHAEESALAKVDPDDPRLTGATMYSTLEPCSERKSVRPTCVDLILAAGIPRVVIAWREPALFVDDCIGVELLVAAGRTVVEIPELAAAARAVNGHLVGH
jgi:diaminohydroxyphosphoribosylaminopyrimidine deaminase / 5-amino-6-(5-phosphoribosylamino)uracil reductase